MKLAWYTPYSDFSAIGSFSREIIQGLNRMGHDVTLVRCEKPDSEAWRSEAPQVCKTIRAIDHDHDAEQFLSAFDMVVYNVGNHLPNHYYAIKHQLRVPGITLLHDYILHHLLNEWTASEGNCSYRDVLRIEAGAEAVEEYDVAMQTDALDWYMSKASRHPVLRFAVGNTLGIVTHAEFYQFVADYLVQCPVAAIPLAFPCWSESALPPPSIQGKKMRLLTIGDVNINKRCEPVIMAIGKSSELSRCWQYRIVGKVTRAYEHHLTQLARSQPFPVDLVLLGKVDDAKLSRELELAQAISCLRFPIIEGASASVVVSLASGRPLLVSNGGCYSEIPEAFVYRVTQTREVDSLFEHLTAISQDYDAAVSKAMDGRRWAIERHSGQHYAQALVPFIESILGQRPVLELTDRIGACLSHWGCPPDATVIDHVEQALHSLFGNAPTLYQPDQDLVCMDPT